jgi:hypothetical protein
MLKSIPGEFTMILSLLEILFSYLCLFLTINMCSLFIKAVGVFLGSLGLFGTKACVGES